MVDDLKWQILQFIFNSRTSTAKDIFTAVLRGSKSPATRYRMLKKLEDEKLIVKKPLYSEVGASSPSYYRLTAKGGRAIGVNKLPSTHYRYQLRQHYTVRVIRKKLQELVSLKRWMLVESEEQCARIIHLYLGQIAKQHGRAFTATSRIKVPPDLVLFTGNEAFIIIISHPNAGRDAFKNRINKYQRLLHELRVICINADEDQKSQWEEAITIYDAEQKTSYKNRFLILMANQIGEIPRLISR